MPSYVPPNARSKAQICPGSAGIPPNSPIQGTNLPWIRRNPADRPDPRHKSALDPPESRRTAQSKAQTCPGSLGIPPNSPIQGTNLPWICRNPAEQPNPRHKPALDPWEYRRTARSKAQICLGFFPCLQNLSAEPRSPSSHPACTGKAARRAGNRSLLLANRRRTDQAKRHP